MREETPPAQADEVTLFRVFLSEDHAHNVAAEMRAQGFIADVQWRPLRVVVAVPRSEGELRSHLSLHGCCHSQKAIEIARLLHREGLA